MESDLHRKFRRVQRLVTHAYDRSQVYKDLYLDQGFHPSQLRVPEDFFLIPVMPRQLLKNIEAQEWRTRHNEALQIHTTSGSSGIPVPVAMTSSERKRIEFGVMRSYVQARLPMHSLTVAFRDPVDIKPPNFIQRLGFARHEYINVFDPIEQSYDRICERHKSIGVLKGYPSDLATLAITITRGNLKFPKVNVVVTDSELLDSATRNILESTFNAPVVDFYASVECGIIASQTVKDSRYKLNSRDVLVEGIELTGNLDAGQFDSVLTSLVNFTTPIIRYQIGDVIEFQEPSMSNPNFSGERFIEKIHGKYLNFIVLPDGSFVSAHLLKQELTHLGRVNEFQFIQKTLDSGELLFVPKDDRYAMETRDLLLSFCKKAFRGLMNIDVNPVEKLNRGDARKFMVVKSEVSARYLDKM